MAYSLSGIRAVIGNILIFIIGMVLAIVCMFSLSFLILSMLNSFAKEGVGGNYEQPVLPEEGLFEAEPAKGRFLVASRTLRDPRFKETVIILVSYDKKGAMGLVINRPMDVLASEMLPDISWLSDSPERVYYGGPVEGHRMFLLVQTDKRPDASTAVFDGVYLSTSKALLERLIKSPYKNERFRIYAGYAGWAGGQLDAEIRRRDWHVLAADSKTLFEMDAHDIWPMLIRRSSAVQVRDMKDFRYSNFDKTVKTQDLPQSAQSAQR